MLLPRGPAVVPIFDISDFPMTLPGLPSSIASSPATTLAPETPRVTIGRSQPSTSSLKPMGPPPVQSSSPKPKAPSREQVQNEVDTIMREVEEKRAKGQPTNSDSMMQCCPPSSSQSLRTQFHTPQSGYIPQKKRTAPQNHPSQISGICGFPSLISIRSSGSEDHPPAPPIKGGFSN